jgi:hypothetical protein
MAFELQESTEIDPGLSPEPGFGDPLGGPVFQV